MWRDHTSSSKTPSRNEAKAALFNLKFLAAFIRERYTMDFAVVTAYHVLRGKVDVLIKLDQGGTSLKDVPIWGRGGSKVRFGWPLTAATFDPITGDVTNQPDVGMLLYPRLDSTRALESFLIKLPFSGRTHAPAAPVFIPGVPIAAQDQIENMADSDTVEFNQIGPTDAFFVNPSGAGLIIKGASNDVLIRGRQVVALDLDQDFDDAELVETFGGTSNVLSAGV